MCTDEVQTLWNKTCKIRDSPPPFFSSGCLTTPSLQGVWVFHHGLSNWLSMELPHMEKPAMHDWTSWTAHSSGVYEIWQVFYHTQEFRETSHTWLEQLISILRTECEHWQNSVIHRRVALAGHSKVNFISIYLLGGEHERRSEYSWHPHLSQSHKVLPLTSWGYLVQVGNLLVPAHCLYCLPLPVSNRLTPVRSIAMYIMLL